MKFSFDHDKITLVADNDNDKFFLLQMRDCFFQGSVKIQGYSHRLDSQCIECLASEKYKDCVILECGFNVETPHLVIPIHRCNGKPR